MRLVAAIACLLLRNASQYPPGVVENAAIARYFLKETRRRCLLVAVQSAPADVLIIRCHQVTDRHRDVSFASSARRYRCSVPRRATPRLSHSIAA